MTRAIQTRERVPQIVRGHAAVRRRPLGPVAGPPVAATASTAISGRDIMRILRKRMWWVIISVAFFGLSAFMTTYIWRLKWPQYSADAEIAINPRTFSTSTETNLLTAETSGTLRYQHARRIRHKNFLNSLQGTMRKMTHPDDPADRKPIPWYEKAPGSVVSRLQAHMRADVIPQENLVRVSLTDVAPTQQEREDLAQVLYVVIQEYVTHVQKITQGGVTDAIRFQERRKEKLLIELDAVRKEIGKLDLPNSSMIGQRMIRIASTLEIYSQRDIALRLNLQQIAAELQNLKQKTEAGKLAEVPELMAQIEQHPRVSQLTAEVEGSRVVLDRMQRHMGKGHPTVIRLTEDLALSAGRLEKIRAEVTETQAKALAEQYKAAGRARQAEVISISDQVKGMKESLALLQENLKHLSDLRSKEQLALRYLGECEQALINFRTKAEEYTPVWVHAVPEPPEKADIAKPTWGVMVPAGLVVGLLLGISLAFLLEVIDTSIKGPRDLTRKVDLPILGMIPHAGDLEEQFECLALAFTEHPNSPMDEAHRQIRTTLLFSGPVSQQRSLLITSPAPSDGRTLHTLNLAHSIAHSGRRVLVVDANFRQPAFRTLFPHLPQEGLSSVLVGQVDWREVVTEVEPNLSVISSGPLPPNPSELLGSEQMLAAMAEMMEAYDQVLFDGSPCVVVTDPISLSTLVDGVILVVRAGSNSTGIVQRARDLLEKVGAHIVGVVLNGVRIEAGGYLRKNYETFYEYRERAMLPPPGPEAEKTET